MKECKTTTLVGIPDQAQTEKELDKICRTYPLLNEPGAEHKKEQIYLLLADGRSEDFLDTFLKKDTDISSFTLDYLRAAARLMGDKGEALVRDQFLFREFTKEEADSILSDALVKEKYKTFAKVEEDANRVAKLEKLISSMESFLNERSGSKSAAPDPGKNREDNETAQFRKRLEKAEETHRKEIRTLKEEYESKIRRLRKRSTKGTIPLVGKQLEKWDQEKINNLLERTFADPEFSKEQLRIIEDAAAEGFSLRELEKLCNSSLPLPNMKMLKRHIENKGG